MPEITDDEFNEYQQLKAIISNKEKQLIWDSINSITNLKDDIDLPIKNCVAYLALLGCEPIFSCCGYDYQGQPIHKFHQYGLPYIILKDNDCSRDFITYFQEKYLGEWVFRFHSYNNFRAIYLELLNHKRRKTPWTEFKNNPHFCEGLVDGILYLEKILNRRKDENWKFIPNRVILEDSNKTWTDWNKYWQYPPRESWIINKEDYQ